MATPPSIPTRPSRSTQNPTISEPADAPKVPPRPSRSIERSVSPHRDTFARSPLNDPTFINGSNNNKRLSASDLPQRPPSVSLPSIGQEGSEYDSIATPGDESSPRETRDAEGLQLHAPRAQVPQSTAKSRIQGVTRTDSSQAAAAGFGKTASSDTDRKLSHSRSPSAAARMSRPQSIHDDSEHGIPSIGLQVPMYPNAGDVQAPTPSQYSNAPSTGIGFFNNGGQSAERHHTRSKSGRENFYAPPGSYGRHGHGVVPQDVFEKDWYAKHPEDAAREAQGEYGPAISENRKEWALSSDQLNRLVQDSANSGVGMGTSPAAVGTPAEEIGYLASEEYASRMASPATGHKEGPKSRPVSQTYYESPLRKASFPAEEAQRPSGTAIEGESEEVIHIDPPANARSHIHGGGPEAADLGPEGGNTHEHGGFFTEEGDGAPILASDELERHKTPGAEFMQPAVPPELERERRDADEAETNGHRRSSSRGSRPTSRPPSGVGLPHWKSYGEEDRSGTPLDDVKEYEPLFPEDDEKKPTEKPINMAEKLKRPDLARHHFPSQDVWEDTPSSLQLQTEVETPQLPDEPDSAHTSSMQGSMTFEKPEDEEARKSITPSDQESFLSDHTKRFAKSHLNRDVAAELPGRPGMQQRFPSQDVWEDTPDTLQLVTEVSAPQEPEDQIFSPEEQKAPAPAAEEKKAPAVEEKKTEEQKAPAPGAPHVPARPQVPSRPARAAQDESKPASPANDRKPPVLPGRPKPQIPVRPAKKDSSENVPLSKTSSVGSTGSENAPAPAAKPKPPVPGRPGGSKIAALKAGFLSDLNSRLQLGPQGPPKPPKEPEKEEAAPEEPKAPLADARKGRARGPARRKPAAATAAATAEPAAKSAAAAPKLDIATPWTIWQISDEGDLDIPSADGAAGAAAVPKEAEASIATQVPADPKPAPEDSPSAEKELNPHPDMVIKGEAATTGATEEAQPESAAAAPAEETPAAVAKPVTEEAPAEEKKRDQSPQVDAPVEAEAEKPASTSTAAAAEEAKEAPTTAEMTDEAVQTGQQDMVIQCSTEGDGAANTEKLTAYLGGRAPEEGSVVVKGDGEEVVGEPDERGSIEKTGGGM
ncbi:uncharacterized protein K452DRAFT_316209 [Aplosporella prunicola CBS 121167]|uniref:Altered inheritance of mitochondria protein 21 n=1 Tax=Aplosporella prunicola CBS 121167 TaxID=1176127 RepID=A0A6A6BQK5_9PEZI|nr:uncharacterized protein K452DRAFT_316209 [Aplosporella prunicola CBS 121167]KAF2145087.1 hypothetical protein K452DRAFT_316209 [Aplosporella prunicola CBS 121167]